MLDSQPADHTNAQAVAEQSAKKSFETYAQMPIKKYVGDLGNLWQFPSDHLPVGAEVDGIVVISWNLLNKAYMDWVKVKNSQGLSGSLITREDVPVEKDSSLTVREARQIQMVLQMSERADIVALQEVSPQFLEALQKALPLERGLLFEKLDCVNQQALIFNKSKLALKGAHHVYDAYPRSSDTPRSLQEVTLHQKSKHFRIINVHVPGDPARPGPEDLANWLSKKPATGEVTIVLGDFNFEADRIGPLFADWDQLFPYPTNVGLDRVSKAIDPIIVHGAKAKSLEPNEVLDNLQQTLDLLQ